MWLAIVDYDDTTRRINKHQAFATEAEADVHQAAYGGIVLEKPSDNNVLDFKVDVAEDGLTLDVRPAPGLLSKQLRWDKIVGKSDLGYMLMDVIAAMMDRISDLESSPRLTRAEKRTFFMNKLKSTGTDRF